MPSKQKKADALEPVQQANAASGSYYYDDAHGYQSYSPDEAIFTIGHSTRSIDEFIGLLRENDIELLVDVRGLPGSNKFPQFNKEELEVSLPAAGIEYVHLKALGGRRSVRKGSQNTVWRNKAFQGYADHMETDDFRDAAAELARLGSEQRTAIMCAEAVWWRCHRSMIADYLKAEGIGVMHIMGPGHLVEHPYTSAAKIIDGRLVYGPAEQILQP